MSMWQVKLGRCIYKSPSGYEVYQNFLYRWLTLGSSALQTVINRRKPQRSVLRYLPALTMMARFYPGNLCLLGLGGAGLLHLLTGFKWNHSLVAVDSSVEILDIAKRFFMVERIPNLKLIHCNAMDYLQGVTIRYKHVIADLYDANHFPVECATEEFFILCKRALTEDGILAVNLANIKEQWPIFQLIKKQFKTAVVIPIRKSANLVVIASANNDKEFFIEQIRNTLEVKKIVWVKNWGYIAQY